MFPREVEGRITKQDYSPSQKIDGVQFISLPKFVDDGGFFLELGRLQRGIAEKIPDFEVRQVNYSRVLHGAVKATHLHKNQDDVWFVPPDQRLLVGLKDIRKDSKTEGVTMRFVLGEGESRLLFIPRGVAHGVGNLWHAPATLIYFVNQQFSTDTKKNDEYRLPPDFFGKDFWSITAG